MLMFYSQYITDICWDLICDIPVRKENTKLHFKINSEVHAAISSPLLSHGEIYKSVRKR